MSAFLFRIRFIKSAVESFRVRYLLRETFVKMHMPKSILLISCLIFLSACLFQGGDRVANKGGGWEDFPNADQNLCGDLTPAQMAAGDSLVGVARPHLDGEAVFLSSDSAQAWSKLKQRDVDSLDAIYTSAVNAAPNHCGALFGKAIVTAYSVVEDKTLDSLVKEAGSADLGGTPILAKLSAEGAAPALLDLRRGMSHVDKSLATLAQQVAEQVLLPKLDSAIQGLERVVGHPGFRFHVGYGKDPDQVYSFDRGEAAPLLATLKIAKALAILVAGYEWNTEIDGSYPYLDTLRHMDMNDLDSLRPGQRAALDHYTGLLNRGSGFSRIRSGWEERTASIPGLLNEAVQHVQDGLQYGITQQEKKLDQKNDPYRVGTDEGSDIDPADLRDAIERLEKTKKYLTGAVAIPYAHDGRILRVDFPKLFRMNGLQGLLPYFRFHPYEEWNDPVPNPNAIKNGADSTRPKGPLYFTNSAGDATLEFIDLDSHADSLSTLTGLVIFPDPTLGGVFPDLTNADFWETAQSLRSVRDRVLNECRSPVMYQGSSPPGCHLPFKPSDLDILVYFLGMAF